MSSSSQLTSPMIGSDNTNPQVQQTGFKQYSYRFVVSSLFCLISLINGMCWVVVTPISVPIQNAYDVSSQVVSLIPMSYMALYIFFNFPSNWVIDVKGIKKGVVSGTMLTVLGCGIRCLVNINFSFVIIGQILCAIGQPFILNAPMKLATRWYMPQNRSLAFSLLTVVNIIGTAVGFLIPPLFVEATQNGGVKDEFFQLLIFEFFLSVVAGVLITVFFRESPPTLPSLGSMAQNTEFKDSIMIMMKDKNFVALALAFGTVNGSFNIYGSLMDDILDPFDYTPDEVSQFGIGLMVTGIISAALIGAYVQKTLQYRRVLIVCSIVGIFTTISFPLAMKLLGHSYVVFLLIVILQGMVFIPLQPLSGDYACDFMFPVGEAQITGTLLTAGQIIGIFFIVVAQGVFGLGSGSKMQRQEASFKSVIFSNAFLAAGCLVLVFVKGELKRSNLEKGKGEKENLFVSEKQSNIKTSGNINAKSQISEAISLQSFIN